MKRFIATCVIATVGCAAGTWGAEAWIASASTGQTTLGALPAPRIALSKVHCNLGTVPPGVPLIARFALRNVGSGRLIIRPENAACCGQAEIDDAITVPPAGSAELVVKIDAGPNSGRLEKAAIYNTNDQALPRFKLTVSAYITKPTRLATK